MSFDLGFLDGEQIELPSGGAFTPSGLIGSWAMMPAWRTSWTELDLKSDPDALGKFKLAETSNSGKFRYYADNPEDGAFLVKMILSDFPAEMVYRLEAETATILNFPDDEVRGKFGATVAYNVSVRTPSSRKYGHEFHLIFLPFAVQAMALQMGFIKEPIFHANELLRPDADYNDAFQREMLGDPDDKSPNALLDSVLGKRRAELWAALGEKNPLAYTVSGNSKYIATSNALLACLRVINTKWTKRVYGEVVNFFDPRVDATRDAQNGDTVRLRISAITRFFGNEAEAKAAAEEELAARAQREGAAVAAPAAGNGASAAAAPVAGAMPAVPAIWQGLEDDFQVALKEALSASTQPAIVAKKVTISKEEAEAWIAYYASQN